MSEIPIVIGLLYGFDGSGHWINHVLIDRYVLGVSKPGDAYDPSKYSLTRKYAVMWAFLTCSRHALYFTLCPLSYYLSFRRRDKDGKNKAKFTGREGKDQVRNEIFTSVWSIAVMAARTAPFELMVEAGWTKLYWDVKDYGWLYLCVTPFLFLIFSDTCIYWIHEVYTTARCTRRFTSCTTSTRTRRRSARTRSTRSMAGYRDARTIFYLPLPHASSELFHRPRHRRTLDHQHSRRRVDEDSCVQHVAASPIHHTMFNYNYGQYFTFGIRSVGRTETSHVPAVRFREPIAEEGGVNASVRRFIASAF